MPSNPDLADRRPGQVPLLLAIAYRAMTDHFESRLVELGREPLRPAHGYTFRYLAAHPGATTVDLAAHLGITKQAASKAVAELLDWGYVQLQPHPVDKRAQSLTLTERGHEYVRLAERLWAEAEQRLADVIGPDHLATLDQDLRAYIDHVYGDQPFVFRPVW